MTGTPKIEIARFAPGRAIAKQVPSLAIGIGLAVAALVMAFAVLASDEIGRSRFSGPLLLIVFAIGSAIIFGRGLIDAARSGPAVEVADGRLRAFTVGFGEMLLSDVSHVRVTGCGSSRRVVVFGPSGPRLIIRADLMSPDAHTIADGIMAARSGHLV